MQDERTCASAGKGGVVGSSFQAAGKPARPPFAHSERAVLPSGVFHGRDTVNSNSSLGDSVSQRGEAVDSLTPRGTDTRHRDVGVSTRTAPFSGGRESLSSRQMGTAWRPPAGLPLPSSNRTTVSTNRSSITAESTGQSSNYAEASAAASFYKQRQQQHSSCIFGDTNDYASSVGQYGSPRQTTNSDARQSQRMPFPENGKVGSSRHPSRTGGRLHTLQSDQLRPAGVPTGVWQSHDQDKQQKQVPGTPKQWSPALLSHNGDNLPILTESQLHNSLHMNAAESSKLQMHSSTQSSTCLSQQGDQTVRGARAASTQQWQHVNTAGSTSRGQDWMVMPSVEDPLSHNTRQPDRCEEALELSNTAVVESEAIQECAHGETGRLGSSKSQDISGSATELVHPPEDSTASSGDLSHHSPASLPTPLPEEHDIDMENGDPLQQQHQRQEQLPDTRRGVVEEEEEGGKEETPLKKATELDTPSISRRRSHEEEAIATGEVSSCLPCVPDTSRSTWSLKTEEENASLRGSRDTAATTRLSRNADISAFVPREDPRSSREKHIESLRSTGSVLPVSVTADAAVAAAAAAASHRCHGNARGAAAGRDGSDNGIGSTPDHLRGGAGGRSSDARAAPYPLNLMEKSADHRDTRRRAATRPGCARLLPLDIPWHCSAASVLGHRGSLSHASGMTHGAHSSPTSDGSRSLCSPVSSNCTQGASCHQELTARERLLHQHCTSSVFAGEDDDSSDAGSRSRQQQRSLYSSTGTPNRVTPLLECEYGTKDENLQRRADQLQNPWYSDLFGRQTPKRSPKAARCAAAAFLANGPEAEATSGREKEDTSKTIASGASAAGSAILGVDGATLDKLCAHRRKDQLLRAPNAYERFISSMQSDIWSTAGDDCDAATQKRLMRAHISKEVLLQEKLREQRRRKRLKEAVNEGHGKYFHMSTSEEARVGEMGKDMDFLGLQMKRAQPAKRSTAELLLFGVRPDMTEEDIEKLCRAAGEEDGKDGCGNSSVGTTTQSGGTVRSSRGGLPKCTLQVKLATNILTSQCKGTGKVTLQYQENEVDIDQVVRRLRNANVGVRQVS